MDYTLSGDIAGSAALAGALTQDAVLGGATTGAGALAGAVHVSHGLAGSIAIVFTLGDAELVVRRASSYTSPAGVISSADLAALLARNMGVSTPQVQPTAVNMTIPSRRTRRGPAFGD